MRKLLIYAVAVLIISMVASHCLAETDATATETDDAQATETDATETDDAQTTETDDAQATKTLPFLDVSDNAWYREAVGFVTGRGIFQGISDVTFAPDDTMTRGMFITALGRYAKIRFSNETAETGTIAYALVNLRDGPDTTYDIIIVLREGAVLEILGTSGDWYHVRCEEKVGYVRGDLIAFAEDVFTDVPTDSYYRHYVAWGNGSGIMTGISDTLFAPDAHVTRELICDALCNYAAATNMTLRTVSEPSAFDDDQDIRYKDSVYAFARAGIIYGRGDGIFDPTAYAMRAEVAAIFQRFNEAVSYNQAAENSTGEGGEYIFGTALAERAPAPDSYFDDAAFVGHSFVTGMEVQGVFPRSGYYGVSGSSAFRFPEQLFPIFDGDELREYGTIGEALAETDYRKIYIFFGTNELGSEEFHRDQFSRGMTTLINIIREALPNAQLYLISIAPVSRSCSQGSESYNRDNIILFNQIIRELSVEHKAVYLDIFSMMCDEDGYLPDADCVADGIHLRSFAKLEDYFRKHTINLLV